MLYLLINLSESEGHFGFDFAKTLQPTQGFLRR